MDIHTYKYNAVTVAFICPICTHILVLHTETIIYAFCIMYNCASTTSFSHTYILAYVQAHLIILNFTVCLCYLVPLVCQSHEFSFFSFHSHIRSCFIYKLPLGFLLVYSLCQYRHHHAGDCGGNRPSQCIQEIK